MGILRKVGPNAVYTSIFEVWTVDPGLATRTTPHGRAAKIATFCAVSLEHHLCKGLLEL